MKFFQLERFVFLFQTTWWSHGNCPFVISYAYMCTCTRLFPRVGSCQRSWWELHKSDATPNRVQWGIPRWSPNQILTSPYLILQENSFDKIYHNTDNFVLLREKPCLSFTSRKVKELRRTERAGGVWKTTRHPVEKQRVTQSKRKQISFWNNFWVDVQCWSDWHLVSQVFEDVHLPKRPLLQKALHILNYFFAAIFSLEFLLKILGLGIITYFSSVWNCLDAFIVAVSITYTIKWGVLLTEWHRFHRAQGEGWGGGEWTEQRNSDTKESKQHHHSKWNWRAP